MYIAIFVLIITFNVILIYYFTIHSCHEPRLIKFPIYIFLHFVKYFQNLPDTLKVVQSLLGRRDGIEVQVDESSVRKQDLHFPHFHLAILQASGNS